MKSDTPSYRELEYRSKSHHGAADKNFHYCFTFTIGEFCAAHKISRNAYYRLPPEDRPKEIRLGRRVLISHEAAAAWRRHMEARNAA